MKKFALIGAAGYIAPRHYKAIKETGNALLAALDHSDSVGVIDQYFPKADFFTEFERFDRHLDKLKRRGEAIDFVSVATPNYLHDSHIRFGLKNNADVICEKPLVLNPWNLEGLEELEKETGRKLNCVLQLRHHPSIIALKEAVSKDDKIHDVDLTYITSRGNWYYSSWKGDVDKSGGIATNIGVHFYDMLSWVFGDLVSNTIHVHTHDRASGFLEFKKARVRWFLSINEETLPEDVKKAGKTTYRSIQVGGEEFEFSNGFTDLHTESYKGVLNGEGYGIKDASTAIEIVHQIRNATPKGLIGDYHPLASLPLAKHPFYDI